MLLAEKLQFPPHHPKTNSHRVSFSLGFSSFYNTVGEEILEELSHADFCVCCWGGYQRKLSLLNKTLRNVGFTLCIAGSETVFQNKLLHTRETLPLWTVADKSFICFNRAPSAIADHVCACNQSLVCITQETTHIVKNHFNNWILRFRLVQLPAVLS